MALLASCSANDQQGQSRTESAKGGASPDISPGAMPGVAFDFAYEFSMPDDKIAASQEAHASACEKLGLARCRITGMSYSVDQDDEVTAELDLKLDPLIARRFGKSAELTIAQNDGKLIRLDIGSSDEAQAIDQATNQKVSTSAQIAGLQQELAKVKPGTEARANLLKQLQSLEQRASGQSQEIDEHQAALASTPMKFRYFGRGGIPGFRGNPLRDAWHTFVATCAWLIGMILQAIAILVPLGLLLGILIVLWRARPMRLVRHWVKGSEEATD
jgi:hypothetical protein